MNMDARYTRYAKPSVSKTMWRKVRNSHRQSITIPNLKTRAFGFDFRRAAKFQKFYIRKIEIRVVLWRQVGPIQELIPCINMTSQGENSPSLKQLRHEGEIQGLVGTKTTETHTSRSKLHSKFLFFNTKKTGGILFCSVSLLNSIHSKRATITTLTFSTQGWEKLILVNNTEGV